MKTGVKIIVLSVLITVVACSTRLGRFTAASTHNVRNLQYSTDENTKQRTQGDTCIHTVFGLPFGHTEDRLERAVDDAILNGQDSGVDGDLLVNVRLDQYQWSVIFYGQDCIEVSGDLVKTEISN